MSAFAPLLAEHSFHFGSCSTLGVVRHNGAKAQSYSGSELSHQCATNMPFVAGYIAGVTDKATVDEMLVTLISVGEVHEKDQPAYMMSKAQAGDHTWVLRSERDDNSPDSGFVW
jgi:hypothetical protein